MARKPVIEQIKMLCLSNKKEITEIKFSSTNFLKMIITWAIFAAFIWKYAAASEPFCFCSSEKQFSCHLIEHYFVTSLYCNTHLIIFPFSEVSSFSKC